ncbi:hypothetical protein [Pseudomonas sp. GW531-R1]|uniref:hypothetical protein n=1 Tax=Pseudomonas sp. GW531-R1 TaxID=2075556 RepID=UPI0011AFA0C4|nr:hypothetical protein [Pseudomonas sp. GW531-R1]
MTTIMSLFEALSRLENNSPTILKKGEYRINNDSVAIEAGAKKGFIRKEKREHHEIVEAIKKCQLSWKPRPDIAEWRSKCASLKFKNERLQMQLNEAWAREVLLTRRLDELERILAKRSNIIDFPKR